MRELDDTHVCPVDGCTVANVPGNKLMCPYHWWLVPHRIQRALLLDWNHGRPRPTYAATRRQAIDAANSAERN